MSAATTAARARTMQDVPLQPIAVNQTIAPVPVYTAPTLAGARVTLSPRFPLIRPEP